MLLYQFEVKERIKDIDLVYNQVLEINNSISDHRSKYRRFSEEMNISKQSLLNCCDWFERILLINCYTFSEQFVKNFFYELLEKGTHNNIFLNNFLDNKIHIDKFSPNVKFKNIESDIQNDLWKDFKFILSPNIIDIKMYDEMIKARHTYAHSGNYNFDFKNFKPSIKTLKYIVFELSMLYESGQVFRKQFQDDYNQIKNDSIAIVKLDKNREYKIDEIKRELKEIRNQSKKFVELYKSIMNELEILKDIVKSIEDASAIDLRKNLDSSVKVINKLKEEISK